MMGATTLLACVILVVPSTAFLALPVLSVSSTRVRPEGRRRPLSSTAMAIVTEDAPTTPLSARRLTKMKAREAREARARAAQVIDTTSAPVSRIASHKEYLRALSENENHLVVVKFFAPWCRSCKAMDVKYRRLAVENESVRFFEVDAAESLELKRVLGVNSVPTIKMYAGKLGQVASFTCGPRKIPELQRKINSCKDVPALAARVSRGTGKIEMVAEMKVSESASSPGNAVPDVLSRPLQPGGGVVKELVEKLARQEKLARALTEAQLSEHPLCAAV